MTDPHPASPESGGKPAPPQLHLVPRDTSFEHPLDETAPKPEPVHDRDGTEIPGLGGQRRDIIPAHLRTRQGIASTAGTYLDAARFHALFHLLRAPAYLARARSGRAPASSARRPTVRCSSTPPTMRHDAT